MKILSLDEAKENPFECEEFQLKNWLSSLSEYEKRDTPMRVTKWRLSGKGVCPSCGKLMALDAENYCDKCGQRIIK